MRLTQFGSIVFPQLNGIQQLPVPFRSSVVPLRGGGFDQDGANSYLDTKVLSLSFWVSVAEFASIDDFINDLYTEASKGRRILLARQRDNALWQAEAKLINANAGADARTYAPDSLTGVQGYERMQVAFEIIYPYWLLTEDVDLSLDNGLFLDDGLFLDAGQQTEITTSSLVNTFTITNNGGVSHEHSELQVWALTGATITDVLVENLSTGEQLFWEGTISPSEILIIKTLPQTIRIDGVDDYANTTLPTSQLGFWKLLLGANNFRVTFSAVSGGDAFIAYKWARHYIR